MATTEQTTVNRLTTNGRAPETAQTPRSKRIVDANQRRAEIVIATLFLLTAVTSGLAGFLLDPLLNASGSLAWVFPNKEAVALDAVLWSINNIGIVFIAVFAFPVLRRLDEALATGYLASRIIEGTIMMVGIIATLLLIPLSQEFLKTGAPQSSWFPAIGDILKQAKFLGLSAVLFPDPRTGWIALYLDVVPVPTRSSGYRCGGSDRLRRGVFRQHCRLVRSCRRYTGGAASFLAVPVATFEIILLPFWLFFNGFKTPEAPERIVAAE